MLHIGLHTIRHTQRTGVGVYIEYSVDVGRGIAAHILVDSLIAENSHGVVGVDGDSHHVITEVFLKFAQAYGTAGAVAAPSTGILLHQCATVRVLGQGDERAGAGHIGLKVGLSVHLGYFHFLLGPCVFGVSIELNGGLRLAAKHHIGLGQHHMFLNTGHIVGVDLIVEVGYAGHAVVGQVYRHLHALTGHHDVVAQIAEDGGILVELTLKQHLDA